MSAVRSRHTVPRTLSKDDTETKTSSESTGKDETRETKSRSRDHTRFKAPVGIVMIVLLFSWRPLELATFIPPVVWRVLLLVGVSLVAYQLAVFKRWNDELKQLKLFVPIFIFGALQLVIENYFVWVVAASDQRKYDPSVRPLQDNVQILALSLSKSSSILAWLLSYHLAHVANLIVIFVCLLFSPAWDQVPYSGFGMASRALLMHAIVRIYRVLCFLAVILPNPRGNHCYRERFPPVPQDWWKYISVGISAMKGAGGCNDLLISGHAVAWMMPVMTVWTFYPKGIARYCVAGAFIQTSIRTAMEGWHYSVDFVLPAIVCVYVYRDLKWVYSEDDVLPLRPASVAKDPLNKVSVILAGLALLSGIVGAFCFGS